MAELPPGKWSRLLVGHVWPDDRSLASIAAAIASRSHIEDSYEQFSRTLANARTGPLSAQSGLAAEHLRDIFMLGEQQSRRIAEKNGIKRSSYTSARDHAVSLQHELHDLASRTNSAITDIEKSSAPTAEKVSAIATAIADCQRQANVQAALCTGSILDALQHILDGDECGQSARHFAQAHGIDVTERAHQPDRERLEAHADRLLSGQPDPESSSTPPVVPGAAHGDTEPTATSPAPVVPGAAHGDTAPNAPSPLPARPVDAEGSRPGTASVPHAGHPNPSALTPSSSSGPTSAVMPAGAAPTSNSTGPLYTTAAPSGHSSGLATSPVPVTAAGTSDPGAFALGLQQRFDAGLNAGQSLAAPTHTVSAFPHQPSGFSTPAVADANTAQPPSSGEALRPSAPYSDGASDSAAAPALSGPALPAHSRAVAGSAPLPSYGSDIKPVNSAAPSPAAATPVSDTRPTTSSVAPALSTATTAPRHPTVVQPASTAPARKPNSGSVVGAMITAASRPGDQSAQAHLRRIVASLARSQPRLAWAAGLRADATTLVTTDLAGGWIPDGVELPADVAVLRPARRRANLTALLGTVTASAIHTPDQPIGGVRGEVAAGSQLPRALGANLGIQADLGWQLCRATKWRDGLPRLACTVARAATEGTGVATEESTLLRRHRESIQSRVLDDYARNHHASDHHTRAVNDHDLGNWQLLAAIEALVLGDQMLARYHFAWFEAQHTSGR